MSESLDCLEGARRRPGMYIGSVDQNGWHAMLWYVIGYRLDAYLAGTLTRLIVRLEAGGGVTVGDNDHGLMSDPLHGESSFEDTLTTSQRRGAHERHPRAAVDWSGQLLCAVNALSSRLVVDLRGENSFRHLEYERGVLRVVTSHSEAGTRPGAIVSFWPDTIVLTATTFDYETIVEHLRVLCYLNPGLTVQAIDARPETPDACAFHFPNGVRAYVRALNRDRRILHKPIGISAYSGSTRIDVAIQYHGGADTTVVSYVNNHRTLDGGTHVAGLYAALGRVLNALGPGTSIPWRGNLVKRDIAPGLCAVVSVWVVEPMTDTSTWVRLSNREVRRDVKAAVENGLTRHFEQSPRDLRKIISHCTAQQGRDA